MIILLTLILSFANAQDKPKGLSPAKFEARTLVGFAELETPNVLKLETGRTLYRFRAKSVILKNRLIERDLGSKKQVRVSVAEEDLVSVEEHAPTGGGR